MQICGIDDAGRGSMLGPLVVAGILIDKKKLRKLSLLGVQDSKKLTPKKREDLFDKIKSLSDDYFISRIYPKSIDANVKKHQLNNLEAKHMAKVVVKLNPDVSYVDSCDVNAARFGKEISMQSNHHKIKSYHHADSRFVVVSAASILAKVARDRSILKIRQKYDVGSGYPSDSTTVKFVRQYFLNNGNVPNFVRRSWKPVQKILNEH